MMIKIIVPFLLLTAQSFSFKFDKKTYELLLKRFDYKTQRNIKEYCHSYETIPPADKTILSIAPYTHVKYRCS